MDKGLSDGAGSSDRAHFCVLYSNTSAAGASEKDRGDTEAKLVRHLEVERLVNAQLLSTGGEMCQDLNQCSPCTGISHAPAQLV